MELAEGHSKWKMEGTIRQLHSKKTRDLMTGQWNAENLLSTARQFQSACVIVAAAELDLILALEEKAMSAGNLARKLALDERAIAMLADALTALGLLQKEKGVYRPASGIAELFDESAPGNVVNMLRHQANCLRSWAQLAWVVKEGTRFDRLASVRGHAEDRRSFIEAMEVASHEAAPRVVASLGSLPFKKLLDIGGGPGTYTRAFLEANPKMQAIYYDLPEVVPIARRHFEAHDMLDRVQLVPGDFYEDDRFPEGADMAWISAIAHQNSRKQNRDLYRKVHEALAPGGSIFIRDMVMSDDHVSPTAGAMFAINMLVNTDAGGTYSFAEQSEDLAAAGFEDPIVRQGQREMDFVIEAKKS